MGSTMPANRTMNENSEMIELRNIVVRIIPESTEPSSPADHDSASKAQQIWAGARKIFPMAIAWVKTWITQLKQNLLGLGGASDISRTLKLQSTVSKLLGAAALTIIGTTIYTQTSPAPPYNWIPTAEICIQYIAVLTMTAGIYQEANRPQLAKWSHRIGQVLFFDGLALAMAPSLGLRPPFILVLLISVTVILMATFLY